MCVAWHWCVFLRMHACAGVWAMPDMIVISHACMCRCDFVHVSHILGVDQWFDAACPARFVTLIITDECVLPQKHI